MHPGEPSHRLLGRWPGCNRGHILTKLESWLFMATGRFRAISTPPQGWLMQSRSTRAARTRFQGRARRRRQSAAPSSWSKSNRFWLGHASSHEIVVTSSGFQSLMAGTEVDLTRRIWNAVDCSYPKKWRRTVRHVHTSSLLGVDCVRCE